MYTYTFSTGFDREVLKVCIPLERYCISGSRACTTELMDF